VKPAHSAANARFYRFRSGAA